MTRSLLLLVSLLLSTPAAFAQGINLYWDDCGAGATQAINKTFACNTNTGAPFTMIASVVPPAELPKFVGVECVVDFLVNTPTPPPWWQVDAGQCRAGAVSGTCDPASIGERSCADVWNGSQPVSISDITTAPYGNAIRIRFAGAIAQANPISAAQVGEELVVGAVRITRAKTTGADACTGCLIGACFVLNQVKLVQESGAGDWWLGYPAANNWVQYNGGTGNWNCYVPALNRTWGSIKTLYR